MRGGSELWCPRTSVGSSRALGWTILAFGQKELFFSVPGTAALPTWALGSVGERAQDWSRDAMERAAEDSASPLYVVGQMGWFLESFSLQAPQSYCKQLGPVF